MFDKLEAAASHISEIQRKVKDSAVALHNSKPVFEEALEKELTIPVGASVINGNICAVDGGLLAQEMYGIDLLVGRAVSVNFSYSDSKLVKSEYFPNAFPEPSYEVKMGLDEHEIMLYRTLFRLDLEISSAISAVEKFHPCALILDGSIVPLATDRPSESGNHEVFEKYQEVIGKYGTLYNLCKTGGTLLLGITKDSRGRRFMDIAGKEAGGRWPDSVFLNQLLKEKERTFAMKYSSNPSKHAVLRDLKDYADSICLFYLKCFNEDRPMRVEFLNNSNPSITNFNEIASIAYSLSAINKSYAYPAVLIEADLRAALDPIEMERALKTLSSLSEHVQPLKRNSRPFR
ncbi:MAG: DNA double-strand break repair nuclease NurA [Candidatus Micrarchaeia archaeon]|jgi:hypothetical protein